MHDFNENVSGLQRSNSTGRPQILVAVAAKILVAVGATNTSRGSATNTSLGLGQKYNKAGGRGQLPIGEAELHEWVVACVLSSNDCVSELQPPIALYEHSLPGA